MLMYGYKLYKIRRSDKWVDIDFNSLRHRWYIEANLADIGLMFF